MSIEFSKTLRTLLFRNLNRYLSIQSQLLPFKEEIVKMRWVYWRKEWITLLHHNLEGNPKRVCISYLCIGGKPSISLYQSDAWLASRLFAMHKTPRIKLSGLAALFLVVNIEFGNRAAGELAAISFEYICLQASTCLSVCMCVMLCDATKVVCSKGSHQIGPKSEDVWKIAEWEMSKRSLEKW